MKIYRIENKHGEGPYCSAMWYLWSSFIQSLIALNKKKYGKTLFLNYADSKHTIPSKDPLLNILFNKDYVCVFTSKEELINVLGLHRNTYLNQIKELMSKDTLLSFVRQQNPDYTINSVNDLFFPESKVESMQISVYDVPDHCVIKGNNQGIILRRHVLTPCEEIDTYEKLCMWMN